jgi:hypothetical protein
MRKTKYAVLLSEAECARLRTLIGPGVAPARELAHARILLKADQGEGRPGWNDAAIADVQAAQPRRRVNPTEKVSPSLRQRCHASCARFHCRVVSP